MSEQKPNDPKKNVQKPRPKPGRRATLAEAIKSTEKSLAPRLPSWRQLKAEQRPPRWHCVMPQEQPLHQVPAAASGRSVAGPLWVQLGLWGLPGRGSAWTFFWFSIVAAIACGCYGFVDHRYFVGLLLLLAALWYYGAIRWVDVHDRWS